MNIRINHHDVFVANGGVDLDSGLPNIVFIHGAGMDHTFWTLNARYFARNGFNVLAPDLPGHGRTQAEAASSISEYAQWVVALLDELQVTNAILVGHSMGSLITLDTAANYPDRVEKVVLLGTALPMRVGEPLLQAAKQNLHEAFDMVSLYGTSFRSQLGSNPLAGVSVLNSGLRTLEQARPDTLYTALSACHEYNDGEAAARNLQCPATIIVGSHDMMTPPRSAQKLAQFLTDVNVVSVDGCGHMHPAEQPEATHQALVTAIIG